MTKGVLEFIGSAQKQIRNKVRRSLQTLQVSADEQELSGKSMIHPDDETIPSKKKQSKAVEKIIVAEKENEPALRRSKRRAAMSNLLNYAESPDDPKASKSVSVKAKPKKSAVKSKKGRPSTLKKSKPGIALNQTKLHFPAVASGLTNKGQDDFELDVAYTEKSVLVTSPSSEATEDSGFVPSNEVSSQSSVHTTVVSEVHDVANSTIIPDNDTFIQISDPVHATAVSEVRDVENSTVIPDDETLILTSANPSLNYWKDLAEQRRIALERTIYENELVHDQLTVLEAENSQLKQLLKEAEHLAEVVKSIVE